MKIDLTGKKYGRWLVLRPDENKKQYWICKCECGTIKSVKACGLKSGRSKSCGCLHKELAREEFIRRNSKDLTGKRFGRLVAMEVAEKRYPTEQRKWKCRCDCGSIVNCFSLNLMRGHTTSCGCMNSYGEEMISKLLCEHGVKFEKNKTFNTCRMPSGSYAKFDFYINDEYLLECDGLLHEQGTWLNKPSKVKERDAIKNAWCKENGITLLRVPYRKGIEIKYEDLIPETSKYVM